MLVKLPLSIVKASGKSVSWIRGEALRLKADVVFIDYLGLINGTGKSRYEIITNVSMELHNMAQQTGITVFALSQLNRNATGRRPTMADLRESGQVEQDADVIVLLHRVNEDLNDMDVIIEKNKEGEVGTVKMKFWGGSQSFSEVLNRYE
jgi:replicative DNA helicase